MTLDEIVAAVGDARLAVNRDGLARVQCEVFDELLKAAQELRAQLAEVTAERDRAIRWAALWKRLAKWKRGIIRMLDDELSCATDSEIALAKRIRELEEALAAARKPLSRTVRPEVEFEDEP